MLVPLSSRELDALAEDIYRDRRISAPTYCDACGYNLKTLPYVYTCPECGQSYNARPMVMKGIFVAYEAVFPFLDCVATAICALAATWLSWKGLPAKDVPSLTLAAVLVLLTLALLNRCINRFHRFNVARRITAGIEEERRES
jgi:predicted RNA-binding Zn-ribbon protein involved in translation (DUF1610 family)